MKKILFIILVSFLTSCNNNEETTPELSGLPPATQKISNSTAKNSIASEILGSVSAHIERNKLIKYNVSGVIGNPEIIGEHDFENNSWRLTGYGSTVNIFFNADTNYQELAMQVTWAGWGEITLVDVFLNGTKIRESVPVSGSAWEAPTSTIFNLSNLPSLKKGVSNKFSIQLSKKSQTELCLQKIELLNLNPKQSLKIMGTSPEYGSNQVKLYEAFTLVFYENIKLTPNKFIKISPKNGHGGDVILISTNNLIVDGNTIRFPRLAVENTNVYVPKLAYQAINEMTVESGVIVGTKSGQTIEGKILEFTTQSPPQEMKVIRTSNNFNGNINWNSISSFHREQLVNAYRIHKLSSATGQNLTGAGIKLAIADFGIAKGSEVYPAVIFRSIDIDDPFINLNFDNTWYSHGTQMARYALGYAPKVNLLDFNKYYHNDDKAFQMIDNQNVDIISFSGSGTRDIDGYSNRIQKGLIVSRSLGNNSGDSNDPSNPRNRDKFLPYIKNLTNAKGAFVTLQAVGDSGGHYSTWRSNAGGAKHYTLSIIETGTGATSQATASFSAIMALMLEANKKYNTSKNPQELVEILMQTATDIGEKGVDNLYGHGLVNIEAALNYLKSGKAPTFKLYESMDKGIADKL